MVTGRQTEDVVRRRWWLWGVVLVVLMALVGVGTVAWMGWKQSVWLSMERLTITMLSPGNQGVAGGVFSYQADEGLLIFLLPREGVLELARGYGGYQVGSLWGLAQQENDYRLIPESMSLLMGAPVAHWVVGDGLDCEDAGCWKRVVRSWLFSTSFTDLPWWDRMVLWWRVKGLRSDQVKVVDLGTGNWAVPHLAADGHEEVLFDLHYIDAQVSSLLADSLVRDENLSAAVVNTVGVPKLAGQLTRLIKGLGVHVVAVNDNEAGLERCLLLTKPEFQESKTVERVERLFSCDRDELDEGSRYDLEVWLGKQQEAWLLGNDL